MKPLVIGHKNLLRVLKIFANYCKAKGFPIVDWMAITKKDFDNFRHSQTGMQATEKPDAIAPATMSVTMPQSSSSMVSVTTSKSSPVTISVMTSESSSSTVSVMTSKSLSYTTSVTTSKSSSDSDKDQDVLAYSNGEAALHHVLSEVLGQPWWLLSEALERSGFNEIQDVLLMNQAKRDMLTFLDGNNVVTPLPLAQKNLLLDIMLFSSYRKRIGRPVINWMKNSKADFDSITLYMEEEKVTIPHHTLESHANTIKPRNVTSTTTVTPMMIPCCTSESHVNTIKPRNVTSTTTVMSIPMIDFSCANLKVKVINAPDIKVTNDLYIKDVNSPLVKQTPPKVPTYKVAPVKQQDTLHNFFCYVDQGTFGIPCKGKIYCPLPGMDPVAWPHEKSTCLPRTLAQLAHQDFKKEPPDNFSIMLSPQYPTVPHSV